MEDLEQKEIENPFDLDVKVKLMELYRKRHALVDLTQVKERYLEVAPLPEELWTEWLEDFSSADLFLYKKALKDFPYPQVLRKLFRENPAEATRPIFLEMKKITRNPEVWLAYISSLQDPGETRKTFEDLLKLPSQDLGLSWKQYEAWEQDPAEKSRMHSFFLSSIEDWLQESEVSSKFSQLSQFTLCHIKTLFTYTKPALHPFIYEELLYRSPKSSDIWEDYIIHQLASSLPIKRTCKRAIRNNPTSVGLWSLLFLCYESKLESLEKKVTLALSQPFEDGKSFTRIWKEFASALARNGKDCIGVLVQGEEWLKSYCPPQHLVLKAFRGNLVKDFRVFEEIVKEQPSASQCWEVYLKFLQEHGLRDRIREVFVRAVESCKDFEGMCERFLEWEMREGGLDEVVKCRRICQTRRVRDLEAFSIKPEKFKMKAKEIKTRFTAFISNLPGSVKEHQLDEVLRHIVRVKAVRIVRDRKGNSRGIAYCDFESQEDLQYAISALNHKELFGNKLEIAVSKPPEEDKNEEKTVFINNLAFTATEEQIKSLFCTFGDIKAVRIIKNSEGKCKGYAYVEFNQKTSADLAISQSFMMIEGRNVIIEKYQENKEQKFVLHVSNLPFDVNEKELAALFPSALSANCPVDRNGKTRGFGFVEFPSEALANEVLESSGVMLNGRYVVVKRSFKKGVEKKLNNNDFKKFL